jgi:hypothetical protein
LALPSSCEAAAYAASETAYALASARLRRASIVRSDVKRDLLLEAANAERVEERGDELGFVVTGRLRPPRERKDSIAAKRPARKTGGDPQLLAAEPRQNGVRALACLVR